MSVTPSTFRQKFPVNPTYKGYFPLFKHLPPAQVAPSSVQPGLVFFCVPFSPKIPLHSELGLSGNNSFILQMGKAETRTLTLGIKNSSALNLYSHSSRKWKRRDNRSCPAWLKQRLSQQKEHLKCAGDSGKDA